MGKMLGILGLMLLVLLILFVILEVLLFEEKKFVIVGEVVKEYVKEVVWDVIDVFKKVGEGFFLFVIKNLEIEYG